ncbi:MAG TPA: hypothetical protein DD381_01760 [Lentisphaeria bacterium]|nr:MAG: hypothetical protein A2X47_10270 [Lentisphaerae bacterium GWF2_38_69]HBM15068.1 hypothetical protein [Lentisphaeria bacterium]
MTAMSKKEFFPQRLSTNPTIYTHDLTGVATHKDLLKKGFPDKEITEKEVLYFIISSWKSHWSDKQDEISLTIRNIVLLKWIKLKYTDAFISDYAY